MALVVIAMFDVTSYSKIIITLWGTNHTIITVIITLNCHIIHHLVWHVHFGFNSGPLCPKHPVLSVYTIMDSDKYACIVLLQSSSGYASYWN